MTTPMRFGSVAVLSIMLAFIGMAAAFAAPSHAIAMHGDPALPADFQHFPYVNPDAPKGGRINYAWPDTFDSVNPFIVQGTAARGPIDLVFGDLVYDRLMLRSADEPFSFYPLLAKTVETDDARSFVEFTLDERAKFSDGQPVTPEDVIFTIKLLGEKGYPRYKVTTDKLAAMEKIGTHGVRFTFKQPDRELPLILANFAVLPKHATNPETFDRSTLKPMIGSGPYRLERIKPGESLTFVRNKDYWAREIPSKRGFDNYDEVTLTYFRDENALFESFRKGLVDVMIDTNSGRWVNQYNFPAVTRGDIVKDTFEPQVPPGMLGIVMNTRRPIFQNREFRAALTDLLDFEWINKNLLNSSYRRTRSFFDNSDLSTFDRPASDSEKKLLAPFPESVTAEILEKGWQPPTSDGSGRDRDFLRVGFERLKAAGYLIKDGRLMSPDGQPVSFEIMLKGNDNEQLAIAWQQTLQKLGINLTIRSADQSQYIRRQKSYDFDVMVFNYTGSASPGAEQVTRFGSAYQNVPTTFNFAGVANPAADAMIQTMLEARERSDYVDAVRAYDRVLLSGAYLIPLYYRPQQWIAHWKRIKRPAVTPLTGAQLPTWWHQPDQ